MMKRKNHHIVVRVPAVMTKRETERYVRDAVRGWAGGYLPPHPLLEGDARSKVVIKGTLYEMERETLMNLKKDVRNLFGGHDWPTGMWQAVDSLIDQYISRS